eukprot:symbB.v1.2.019064.t1/scaffold1536.1/size113067/4
MLQAEAKEPLKGCRALRWLPYRRRWDQVAGKCYRAKFEMNQVCVTSKCCDLPTAVDYLMILMAAKNHGGDHGSSADMHRALQIAAQEQGHKVSELGLTFSPLLHHRFWFGPRQTLRLPAVRTIPLLEWTRQQIRPYMEKTSIFDQGPLDFEKSWIKFLRSYETICNSEMLLKAKKMYQENKNWRCKQLERWEQKQMAQEERAKFRVTLRCQSPTPSKSMLTLRRVLAVWQRRLDREKDFNMRRRAVLKWQLARKRLACHSSKKRPQCRRPPTPFGAFGALRGTRSHANHVLLRRLSASPPW